MDKLLKPDSFTYKGFDSVFCCLGSQTKHGEETFVKVDKLYPLSAADIALKNSTIYFYSQKSLIIFWCLQLELIKSHGFSIQGLKDKFKMNSKIKNFLF